MRRLPTSATAAASLCEQVEAAHQLLHSNCAVCPAMLPPAAPATPRLPRSLISLLNIARRWSDSSQQHLPVRLTFCWRRLVMAGTGVSCLLVSLRCREEGEASSLAGGRLFPLSDRDEFSQNRVRRKRKKNLTCSCSRALSFTLRRSDLKCVLESNAVCFNLALPVVNS